MRHGIGVRERRLCVFGLRGMALVLENVDCVCLGCEALHWFIEWLDCVCATLCVDGTNLPN